MPDSRLPAACEVLADLVGFDTTSRYSNLALIDHVAQLLDAEGIVSQRVLTDDGAKASLIATIGPDVEGGIVLSGHTDVVPVDGQAWSTDPFDLTELEGRLYGRGTCDMKGFIAAVLAMVPELARMPLVRPIHLALSHDEEVGCIGAPALIAAMGEILPRPAVVIVGEPTNMAIINAHKGMAAYEVEIRGKAAHSSQTHLGLSANRIGVQLMAELEALADQLGQVEDSGFRPTGPSLTIGQIEGGTAINILAELCRFRFDLRVLPGENAEDILAPFRALCAEIDLEMRGRFAGTGVVLRTLADTPPLAPESEGLAEALVRRVSRTNLPASTVAYAAEAGQFQQAGYSVVLCGPGSMNQGHQADEFVTIDQLDHAVSFIRALGLELCHGA